MKHFWFAGTPEFAAHSLEALIAHEDYHIDAVLTQPDRPKGRGRKLQQSAVKQSALKHQIPLAQPEKLTKSAPPFADMPRPELIIVAAYGILLPQWFLQLPRLGCINIHASLLPRWRGAAPIQRAIEAGDEETGISIMQMDEGLDTGAVWLEKRLKIGDNTAHELHERLKNLGASALLEALPIILEQRQKPKAQDENQATYAKKLHKQESFIDWQLPSKNILQKIRALNPSPIAQSFLEQEILRIHTAHPSAIEKTNKHHPGEIIAHDKNGITVATSDGTICIETIQLPGKKTIHSAELRHSRNLTGKIFA